MKEFAILVCVLLISWCVSKMMPELDNDKDIKVAMVIQAVLNYALSFIVLLRYYNGVRPILALVVSIVVLGIINVKLFIQLVKKKDLVY